jgi:hypothetical protein
MTHAKIVGEITAPNGLGYLANYRREKNLPGGVKPSARMSTFGFTRSRRGAKA